MDGVVCIPGVHCEWVSAGSLLCPHHLQCLHPVLAREEKTTLQKGYQPLKLQLRKIGKTYGHNLWFSMQINRYTTIISPQFSNSIIIEIMRYKSIIACTKML